MIPFIALKQTDPALAALVELETHRQQDGLSLIPSENHSSSAVLEALATTLSDKYAEGYPGRRYYTGNAIADQLETLVQERAKRLFGVPYANVQPYSGSPANLAVYLATCAPHEPFMGLDLPHGGHLTHGWKMSATSQFWNSIPYHLNADGSFDFDEIERLAKEHHPKLIWCGATACPRAIPFKRFADIAERVGAYLVADISHISGLIAGGQHEHPAPYAHIITTTTHKTLRGPRGAIIMVTEKGLSKDPDLGNKIDKAIIPGLQGGPHLNTIAAIGVALLEAAQPAFSDYARNIVHNAARLADHLLKRGFSLVSGGTDNHLILIDLTPTGAGRGKFLHLALEAVGLYANMNTVPGEQSSPFYPSGLRLGTPAATSRGMGEADMERIADWIKRVADHMSDWHLPEDKASRQEVVAAFIRHLSDDPFYPGLREEVRQHCRRFPLPALS